MPLGECIKEDFVLIGSNPQGGGGTYNIPSTSTECCFELIVLAEASITNALRNDSSEFIRFYGNTFSSIVMTLQQWDGSSWGDVKTLNNNDVGTYSAFGFFTNELNEKGVGYLIDWQKVLTFAGLGEGSYRIKATENNIIAAVQYSYSFEYCLQTWTQDRENETVKLEWYMNGFVGDPDNDKKQRHFASQNRYNQLRLKGYFGQDTTPIESEYIHYQNGKEVWTKNKFFDEYTLEIYPLPYYLHKYLKSDLMLGDDILITDFNGENPVQHIQRAVKAAGNYEPAWNFGQKNASVTLKFAQLYQNNTHKRC